MGPYGDWVNFDMDQAVQLIQEVDGEGLLLSRQQLPSDDYKLSSMQSKLSNMDELVMLSSF